MKNATLISLRQRSRLDLQLNRGTTEQRKSRLTSMAPGPSPAPGFLFVRFFFFFFFFFFSERSEASRYGPRGPPRPAGPQPITRRGKDGPSVPFSVAAAAPSGGILVPAPSKCVSGHLSNTCLCYTFFHRSIATETRRGSQFPFTSTERTGKTVGPPGRTRSGGRRRFVP